MSNTDQLHQIVLLNKVVAYHLGQVISFKEPYKLELSG